MRAQSRNRKLTGKVLKASSINGTSLAVGSGDPDGEVGLARCVQGAGAGRALRCALSHCSRTGSSSGSACGATRSWWMAKPLTCPLWKK